jgi:hypothetical protein
MPARNSQKAEAGKGKREQATSEMTLPKILKGLV